MKRIIIDLPDDAIEVKAHIALERYEEYQFCYIGLRGKKEAHVTYDGEEWSKE